MSKKAPITPLEIVPKTEFTDTVSVNSQGQMAAAILTDIENFDRLSREAAFIALRVGLRLILIRDNGQRGSLAKFIRDHFKGKQTERTLFRYISIAEAFAKDCGLLEKKTHKLTNGEAIAPILDTQLELFTDPNATFEGAMKKLMKWVGERGLSDLYKEQKKKGKVSQDEEGDGPKIKTAAELAQEAEEELNFILNQLDGWILAAHHTRVPKEKRDTADAVLEAARQKIKAVK